MAIQSTGVGSGLDVNSIITQLMAVERRPLAQMEKQAATVQAQLSAFGGLQSRVTALGDLAKQLGTASTWARTTATSGDASTVAVTATNTALPASLRVEVSALAQAQSITTRTFSGATEVVGTGTLRIELGGWSTGFASFTAKVPAAAVDITIGTAEQTLAGVRDKINAANAGVSASILNDASGSRLVLRSTATGEVNGFRLTVTDDDTTNADAAGLSALAFNPPATTSTSGNVRGSNLAATVNGAPVVSASNKLENLVEGVTLQVNKATTGPVDLTVANDTAGLKTLVQQFVTAYNDANKFLVDQTRYNADTKTAATLQGDRLAVSLQGQLRALIGANSQAATAFTRLSDVGLELQRDGSLKVNDTKLDTALNNLPQTSLLFSRIDDSNALNQGIARRLMSLADGTGGTGGSIDAREDSLRLRLDRNKSDQERFNDRLTQIEARLRAQYTALDRKMSQLNGLSAYVTQQVNLLNRRSSNDL